MRLKKALRIIKSKKFSIFVYENGINTYEIFDIERNANGDLPNFKYGNTKVREIIPHNNGVNISIDIGL